ncbi:MerR family transcriptional regulator [Goodfellowiella coeruleoviolacea]|uniref:DNA-binding transcriptional regulator, MerR family n=1 Tax=Goodfellowiella coeruleoviolacea TaxID=334858 RepID=A0AAE3G943_9PSEU|nr:MerR family transcriptional regulator [Goodfellowiella coeruleoviolacea]MCP2163937.1 DNA-binding transcriptional regulator, MerR family [Goodfellowiella coeruleoviolacea]
MKSSGDHALSIGAVAARFGVATHVLRHWESVGLLTPARVHGDRRRYGREDLHRVAVILRAKQAGLGLDAIRQMLAGGNSAQRREVLRRQHAELTRRVAEAQAALRLVECALRCDHEDVARCAHFQAVVAEGGGP